MICNGSPEEWAAHSAAEAKADAEAAEQMRQTHKLRVARLGPEWTV